MSDWTPTHFTDAGPPDQVSGTPAPQRQRRTDVPSDHPTMPVTLVLTLPPYVTAALSTLAEDMGKLMDSVAKQGEAIQKLAEAIASQKPEPSGADNNPLTAPPEPA